MVESVLHVWQTMITLICLNMIEREILVLSILKIQRVERKSVTNSASCIWLQTLSRPAWRVVFVNFYDFYWMNNYRNNSNNLDWLQYHTLARWNNSMRKWRPGRSHSSVRWFSIFCELSVRFMIQCTRWWLFLEHHSRKNFMYIRIIYAVADGERI